MKKIPLLIITLLSCISIHPQENRAYPKTYKYEEKTGKSVKYFTRIFSFEKENYTLIYNEDDKVISTAQISKNMIQYNWWFINKKEGTDIFFERKKNVIEGKGIFKSKPFSRKYQIGKDEWIQVIEFSLSDFVTSHEKRKYFWAIRPTDMNIFKMQMEKKGGEIITFGGKSHQSVKMVLSAQGFSAFWHADYWFSPEEKILLKYEAYRSMDRKEKTFIELISDLKSK